MEVSNYVKIDIAFVRYVNVMSKDIYEKST